ncbi:hypothetical protein AMATHDRAFT_5226 [Amanita thiersii Skay4041]|uniref:Uncharacterized protein n=1 Tax=Amanita thiersii Skay4041 TaxID=703135 RepID=A0A2A9NL87_9AGAR|nr:hypothetical protein AMATHDRAFT_5226 [Amanita thiersii Skay4041]
MAAQSTSLITAHNPPPHATPSTNRLTSGFSLKPLVFTNHNRTNSNISALSSRRPIHNLQTDNDDDDGEWYIPYNGPYELPPSARSPHFPYFPQHQHQHHRSTDAHILPSPSSPRRSRSRDSWGDPIYIYDLDPDQLHTKNTEHPRPPRSLAWTETDRTTIQKEGDEYRDHRSPGLVFSGGAGKNGSRTGSSSILPASELPAYRTPNLVLPHPPPSRSHIRQQHSRGGSTEKGIHHVRTRTLSDVSGSSSISPLQVKLQMHPSTSSTTTAQTHKRQNLSVSSVASGSTQTYHHHLIRERSPPPQRPPRPAYIDLDLAFGGVGESPVPPAVSPPPQHYHHQNSLGLVSLPPPPRQKRTLSKKGSVSSFAPSIPLLGIGKSTSESKAGTVGTGKKGNRTSLASLFSFGVGGKKANSNSNNSSSSFGSVANSPTVTFGLGVPPSASSPNKGSPGKKKDGGKALFRKLSQMGLVGDSGGGSNKKCDDDNGAGGSGGPSRSPTRSPFLTPGVWHPSQPPSQPQSPVQSPSPSRTASPHKKPQVTKPKNKNKKKKRRRRRRGSRRLSSSSYSSSASSSSGSSSPGSVTSARARRPQLDPLSIPIPESGPQSGATVDDGYHNAYYDTLLRTPQKKQQLQQPVGGTSSPRKHTPAPSPIYTSRPVSPISPGGIGSGGVPGAAAWSSKSTGGGSERDETFGFGAIPDVVSPGATGAVGRHPYVYGSTPVPISAPTSAHPASATGKPPIPPRLQPRPRPPRPVDQSRRISMSSPNLLLRHGEDMRGEADANGIDVSRLRPSVRERFLSMRMGNGELDGDGNKGRSGGDKWLKAEAYGLLLPHPWLKVKKGKGKSKEREKEKEKKKREKKQKGGKGLSKSRSFVGLVGISSAGGAVEEKAKGKERERERRGQTPVPKEGMEEERRGREENKRPGGRPRSFSHDDLSSLVVPMMTLEQVVEEGFKLEMERQKWQQQAVMSFGNKKARVVSRSRSKSLTAAARLNQPPAVAVTGTMAPSGSGAGVGGSTTPVPGTGTSATPGLAVGTVTGKVAHHMYQSSIDFLAARACLGNQDVVPLLVVDESGESEEERERERQRMRAADGATPTATVTANTGHARNDSWSRSAMKLAKSTAVSICGLGSEQVSDDDEHLIRAAAEKEREREREEVYRKGDLEAALKNEGTKVIKLADPAAGSAGGPIVINNSAGVVVGSSPRGSALDIFRTSPVPSQRSANAARLSAQGTGHGFLHVDQVGIAISTPPLLPTVPRTYTQQQEQNQSSVTGKIFGHPYAGGRVSPPEPVGSGGNNNVGGDAIWLRRHPYAHGGNVSGVNARSEAGAGNGYSNLTSTGRPEYAGAHPASVGVPQEVLATMAGLSDVLVRHRLPPHAQQAVLGSQNQGSTPGSSQLHPHSHLQPPSPQPQKGPGNAGTESGPQYTRVERGSYQDLRRYVRVDSDVPVSEKLWVTYSPGVVREVLASEIAQYSPYILQDEFRALESTRRMEEREERRKEQEQEQETSQDDGQKVRVRVNGSEADENEEMWKSHQRLSVVFSDTASMSEALANAMYDAFDARIAALDESRRQVAAGGLGRSASTSGGSGGGGWLPSGLPGDARHSRDSGLGASEDHNTVGVDGNANNPPPDTVERGPETYPPSAEHTPQSSSSHQHHPYAGNRSHQQVMYYDASLLPSMYALHPSQSSFLQVQPPYLQYQGSNVNMRRQPNPESNHTLASSPLVPEPTPPEHSIPVPSVSAYGAQFVNNRAVEDVSGAALGASLSPSDSSSSSVASPPPRIGSPDNLEPFRDLFYRPADDSEVDTDRELSFDGREMLAELNSHPIPAPLPRTSARESVAGRLWGGVGGNVGQRTDSGLTVLAQQLGEELEQMALERERGSVSVYTRDSDGATYVDSSLGRSSVGAAASLRLSAFGRGIPETRPLHVEREPEVLADPDRLPAFQPSRVIPEDVESSRASSPVEGHTDDEDTVRYNNAGRVEPSSLSVTSAPSHLQHRYQHQHQLHPTTLARRLSSLQEHRYSREILPPEPLSRSMRSPVSGSPLHSQRSSPSPQVRNILTRASTNSSSGEDALRASYMTISSTSRISTTLAEFPIPPQGIVASGEMSLLNAYLDEGRIAQRIVQSSPPRGTSAPREGGPRGTSGSPLFARRI